MLRGIEGEDCLVSIFVIVRPLGTLLTMLAFLFLFIPRGLAGEVCREKLRGVAAIGVACGMFVGGSGGKVNAGLVAGFCNSVVE
jgi:hypothetical protein